jgi:hypothetical protein
MTDRAAEFKRQKNRASMQRTRARAAGLLPPLPVCPRCGARCFTDRWLPLCSLCAKAKGHYSSRQVRGSARPIRLAAEEILLQLRAEAREEAGR